MEKKKEIWMAIKFTLISVSAGIVQAVLFAVLNELLHLNYSFCYITALAASVIWNFFINQRVTFRSKGGVWLGLLKVAIFYAVFTPLSTWGGNLLTEKGWNEYLVLAISMVLNMVLEYLYDRFLVFGSSIGSADSESEEVKE